jgi:hypothetical protein
MRTVDEDEAAARDYFDRDNVSPLRPRSLHPAGTARREPSPSPVSYAVFFAGCVAAGVVGAVVVHRIMR